MEMLRQVDAIREAHDATSALVMDNIRRVEKYLKMDEEDIHAQQNRSLEVLSHQLLVNKLQREAKDKQAEIDRIISGKHHRLDTYFDMLDQAQADEAALNRDAEGHLLHDNASNASNVTTDSSREDGTGWGQVFARLLFFSVFLGLAAGAYFLYKRDMEMRRLAAEEQKAAELDDGLVGDAWYDGPQGAYYESEYPDAAQQAAYES